MTAQADLVVVNARVLTMDPANPSAQAVAVKDGRILAVGDRQSVAELRGPHTRVIDAEDASVVPGFVRQLSNSSRYLMLYLRANRLTRLPSTTL